MTQIRGTNHRRFVRRRRFSAQFRRVFAHARRHGRGLMEQPRLWLLALIVGALAGLAAVALVVGIDGVHKLFFGADELGLVDAAEALPIVALLVIPTFGGLIAGLLLKYLLTKHEHLTVADVMEARARSAGRLSPFRGFVSTLASIIALGMGASAGREGPAVVAGAAVSSSVARLLRLDEFEQRTLLGCAVAAAVSASFNAPIAGALFALEVVLGHYAVRAFAPISIASVAGALLCWSLLGDESAFKISALEVDDYVLQFPALFLLGLVSAAVAMVFMGSIQIARDAIDAARRRAGAPLWAQTALAGLTIGAIAAAGAPQVLGVGYQTTSAALASEIGFWGCVGIAAAKIFASAISIGGRIGAGVFSPALMLGALTGSAFGRVATSVFPDVSGGLEIYALAGMGAVAGSVLGAPISTTLIVFELTENYGAALAVMVSTSVATVATQQIFRKSYFHWQLARRGVDLIAGPEHSVLPGLKVGRHMRWRGSENSASDSAAQELAQQGAYLEPDDDFRRAFDRFRGGALAFLPVLDPNKDPSDDEALLGALFYVDALQAYNRALLAIHEEEHS